MNTDEPDLPPDLAATLGRLARQDTLTPHPAAEALRAFDEEPASLAPRTRAWIEAHLARCAACAGALAAVPRLEARARPLLLRPWPLAAAAGWLLAALLALRAGPGSSEPFPRVHTLVLSSPRGAEPVPIPLDARLLRLELVLGEEVPLGGVLGLRLEDAGGRAVLARDYPVTDRNERDWPVLTLERAALPEGTLRLTVTAPSGASYAFELDL
jgi:hypothetical protein